MGTWVLLLLFSCFCLRATSASRNHFPSRLSPRCFETTQSRRQVIHVTISLRNLVCFETTPSSGHTCWHFTTCFSSHSKTLSGLSVALCLVPYPRCQIENITLPVFDFRSVYMWRCTTHSPCGGLSARVSAPCEISLLRQAPATFTGRQCRWSDDTCSRRVVYDDNSQRSKCRLSFERW